MSSCSHCFLQTFLVAIFSLSFKREFLVAFMFAISYEDMLSFSMFSTNYEYILTSAVIISLEYHSERYMAVFVFVFAAFYEGISFCLRLILVTFLHHSRHEINNVARLLMGINFLSDSFSFRKKKRTRR